MKLLIVDDEQLIRDGIRSMLQGMDAGATEALEACNGVEALRIIAETGVDIVVTDIKMHDMDGIALLRETGSLKARPEFIILSGYDDFQYAKESIRYGAKAYLLKPVKKKELFDTIRMVEEEILSKRSQSEKLESLSSFVNDVWEHELNYLIVHEGLSEQETARIADALGIRLLRGSYYAAILEKRRKKTLESDPLSDYQTMKRYVADFIASAGYPSLAFSGVSNNIVLLSESEGMFQALAEHLKAASCGDFTIGTSRGAAGAGGLQRAYREASEALKYKVIRNADALIRFDAVDRLDKSFTLPAELLGRIVRLIGTRRDSELNELINQAFDSREILSHSIRYVERLAEEAYRLVIEPFVEENVNPCGGAETQTELLQSIHHFDYINDYIYAFKKFVFDINACLLDLAEEYKGMSEIDEALEYVRNNYQKDLNLTVVANHVSLNYSYFSNLFSEKTGVNFHDYLKTVRIDRAKELLTETNSRINEIAKKVGYKNPKHFATHFRSLTGISPQEYRSKAMLRRMQ